MIRAQRGLEIVKMEFRRFLHAIIVLSAQIIRTGRRIVYRLLSRRKIDERIPVSIHQSLLSFLKRYCIIGGMPSAVREFREGEDYKLAHMDLPSKCSLLPAVKAENRIPFTLISLPLYMIDETSRIIDQCYGTSG